MDPREKQNFHIFYIKLNFYVVKNRTTLFIFFLMYRI